MGPIRQIGRIKPMARSWRTASAGSRGSALLVAVGFLAALTGFAAVFLMMLNRHIDERRETHRRQVCFYAAEAGVHKAIAELRRDRGYTGEEDMAFGGTRIAVTAGEAERPATVRIVSRAQFGDGGPGAIAWEVDALVEFAEDGAWRIEAWSSAVP
jgi:hypothetical protein